MLFVFCFFIVVVFFIVVSLLFVCSLLLSSTAATQIRNVPDIVSLIVIGVTDAATKINSVPKNMSQQQTVITTNTIAHTVG